MSRSGQRAEFVKWMNPVLDALRELGGFAKPRQVSNWIAEKHSISEDQQEAKMKSGAERFHNQVCWARQYLVWEGLLDGSKRGVWKLTGLGAKTHLTEDEGRAIFKKWVEIYAKARRIADKPIELKKPEEVDEDESPEEVEEQEILGVIQDLPPAGFERLCKRLLTEWGFQNIEVTGKSHDGGVDGTAVLLLNPFVSFDVAFQCKRYRGAVRREHVAAFRGSKKSLHAEKLIFLTTGYFTKDAKKEAKGEGAIAVELIDGEMLVDLFEKKELGLKLEEVFRIDHAFFDQFR